MIVAHAAWFVHGRFPYDWSFAGETLSLAYITLAVALALVVRVASKRWSAGKDIRFLARLVPWMPFVVRLHLSVALIMLASFGRYLTPAMHLHQNVHGYLLGPLELIVAVLFAAGWKSVIAPVAAFPFFATLTLLGTFELGGHLPAPCRALCIPVFRYSGAERESRQPDFAVGTSPGAPEGVSSKRARRRRAPRPSSG